ncbi:hypothetical protein RHSIM_Rhsim09G0032400 [Rhododendron simsii]|uniref:Rx N-terminal domain-containing protein n=1 Tax=Rhododendron simsii TaxID=118357 RepID=A0A834GHM3_RHOSS|nr:hypothetical protein RHSIM_Rhsim09G0032400 [Rhododendron simsii]
MLATLLAEEAQFLGEVRKGVTKILSRLIFVQVVVEKLATLLAEEAQFLGGVRRGVSELRDDLESMRSFLQDAESRTETEKAVETWVKQVRDVAHDTEDILDEFALRLSLPSRPGRPNGNFVLSLQRFFHCIRHLRTRHRLAGQIEDVKTKIKDISDRQNAFSFRRIENATSSRCGKKQKREFQRDLIQWANYKWVRTCRVHDVMREIIQLKSRNESFVLILNDKRMSLDEKIRRMAIHDSCEELPLDKRFASLRSLLVFASSMSLGKAFFKGFRLLGLLELDGTLLFEFPLELLPNLPKWIASLSYLAKLVLQYSNLNDDPLKALQGLPNLVVLELRDAYSGEELCCDDGGYPRLKKLGLLMLSQLKTVRMEQGSLPELRVLDIAACEKLQMVPLGIQHLRNLQDLTVWNMPYEFQEKIERPHGEDFWRVQNVTNIWSDRGRIK